MTKDWFDIKTEPDGTKYVHQVKDELDKNHRKNDYSLTNQGKMYAVPGNKNFLYKYHVNFLEQQLQNISFRLKI